MKRIGIYFFCVVAFGCVTSGILYRSIENEDEIRVERTSREEVSEQIEDETNSGIKDMAVNVSDSYKSDERFLVIAEEGYLVIYDRMTMRQYDETPIQVSSLPMELQKRVQEGLYFVDEEALYAFLENYSS